jgi:hypothetical protein
MERKELDVYSEAGNSSIVRMPSRRFPGVVIQGDSLASLFAEAMTLVEKLENSDDEEIFLTSLEIAERLEGHLLYYEATLQGHGIICHMCGTLHGNHLGIGTDGKKTPNQRLKTDVENARLFRLAYSPRLSRIALAAMEAGWASRA